MRAIVQRSKESSVLVNNKITGKISKGFVILVGFTEGDNLDIIQKLVKKIINLRIFDDENGVMNKSLIDVGGDVLSISQFTLYADTKKGNRPSYMKALNGNEAIKLYQLFNEELSKFIHVETGVFGAEMEVHIINDGPITISLDSDC